MKKQEKLAIELTFSMLIFFSVFGFIFLYIYSDSNSVRDFFSFFINNNEFFWKDIKYFYLYVFIKTISIILGVYFISYYFSNNLLKSIFENNKKLKKYNHYIAHELKNPISVIYSNLEVLKYSYDIEKIDQSKMELKSMIKIIDSILNYSESIKVSDIKNINLENFIKKYSYFNKDTKNIFIHNKEFNVNIDIDETLFWRVISNLIDNWLKYSSDWKLDIFISNNSLKFVNLIDKTLDDKDINLLFEKYYSKSFEEKKWHWIWLSMIKDILNSLWYTLNVYSEDKRFIVEIILIKKDTII